MMLMNSPFTKLTANEICVADDFNSIAGFLRLY